MNLFDIFVFIVLGYFAFAGFRNGFVREVLGLTGLIIALFLAFRYLEPLNSWLIHVTGVHDAYSLLITFALIFLLVILLVHLAIISIEYLIKVSFLSTTNRVFGLLFGVLKSSVFVSMAVILLVTIEIPGEKTRQTSLTYPIMEQIAPVVYNGIATIYPNTLKFQESVQRTIEEHHIFNFR